MNEKGNMWKISVLAVLIVGLVLSVCIPVVNSSPMNDKICSSKVPDSMMTTIKDSSWINGVKSGGELAKVNYEMTLSKLPERGTLTTNISEYYITATGSPVLLPGGPDVEEYPSLAVNSSGGIFAAYESWNTGDSTWDMIVADSSDNGATWHAQSLAWTGSAANPRNPHIYINKNQSSTNDMYWIVYLGTDPAAPLLGWGNTTNPSKGWFGGGGLNIKTDFVCFRPYICAVWNSSANTVAESVRLFDKTSGMWTTNVIWNYKDNKGSGLPDWPGVSLNNNGGLSWFSTNVVVTTTMTPSQRNVIYWPVEKYNTTSGEHDVWTIWGTAAQDSAGNANFNDWQFLNAYEAQPNVDVNPWTAASGANGYFFVQRDNTVVTSYTSDSGANWNSAPVTVAGAGTIPAGYANPTDGTKAQVIYVNAKDLYHTGTTDGGATWVTSTWPGKVNDNAGSVNSAVGSIYIHVDGTNTPRVVWDDSRSAMTAPTVSVDPADSATNVPIDKPVVITFSKTMDTYSVKFSCSPDPGGWSAAWTNGDTVLTMSHSMNFAQSTVYTCTMSNALDTLGQPISPLPYTWSFTTAGPGNTPSVTVDKPISTDKWPVGSSQNIQFTITGGTSPYKYWINYTITSGPPYNPIAGAQGGTGSSGSNTYAWNPIPAPASMQAKIQVDVLDNTNLMATATSPVFEITAGSGDNPPVVSVKAPDGGENWAAGSVHDITWIALDDNAFPGTPVNISYTPDGTTWNVVSSNEPNDGTYSWTVPTIATTTNAKVKVDVYDSKAQHTSDESNATFTITGSGGDTPPVVTVTAPDGGETWDIGTAHDITWTATDDNTLPASPINISLSRDNGVTWESITNDLPNTSPYSWTVTGTATATQCYVKVTAYDSKSQTTEDQSNAVFTINKPAGMDTPPVVTVTSPNGAENWTVGSTHDITWTATDDNPFPSTPINLSYSTNGGSTWIDIKTGEANDGSYTWTVPNAASPNCKVKVTAYDSKGQSVSDISNSAFIISGGSGGKPPAPTNLAATGSDGIVVLSWTWDINITTWNVYRSDTSGSGYVKIATAMTFIYSDTSVTNGKTYYYVVTAVAGTEESDYSNEASATPQGAGGGLNMMLVIGIVAIIIVVVVVLLLVLMMRKKKAAQAPPPTAQVAYGPMPPPGAGGYPPQEQYPPQQPGYGAPPQQPGYGAPPPQQQYGAPPPGYGAPPPQQQYGAPPPGYGAPPPQGMPCPRCGNINVYGAPGCAFCGMPFQ